MTEDPNRKQPMVEEIEVIIVEIVDIEEYAKKNEKPPRARQYKFRVDDSYYTTEKAELTGREILALAGKTPESCKLHEQLHHGKTSAITPDDVVNLHKHGVERFITLSNEDTDRQVLLGDREKHEPRVRISVTYTSRALTKQFQVDVNTTVQQVIDRAYEELGEKRRTGDSYFGGEDPHRIDLVPYLSSTLADLIRQNIAVQSDCYNKGHYELTIDIESPTGGA